MNKELKYKELLLQCKGILDGETDLIANLANLSACIHSAFKHHWVGFYLFKDNQLILGPFQGPVACTRIKIGKGVCGEAYSKKETMVVADVNSHPNHIACSPFSQSEIVVPFFRDGYSGVLDIDSDKMADFDAVDKEYLEKIISLL